MATQKRMTELIPWSTWTLCLLSALIMIGLHAGCRSIPPARQATEIHVSPTGRDTDSGTLDKPFRTLERARKQIASAKSAGVLPDRGVTVWLHGGTYALNKPLQLGSDDSGEPGKPIIWQAFAGEKPVVSGGIAVKGWTPDKNGRFKATVEIDNFRQLWVNGQRAQRARGHVPAGLKFWGKHEASVAKANNRPGLTGTPGCFAGTLAKIAPAGYTTTDASLAQWKNAQDMEFGYYTSWTHMISKIESITKTDAGARIEMSQPGFFLNCRKGGSRATHPAYMENALELLDEPGEWYFDRPAHTLYYLPRPGEDMTKAEVVAPRLEKLLVVKGTPARPVHDIQFKGLTFSYATWLKPCTSFGHPDGQANFTQPADNSFFRPEHERGWVPVNGEHVKSPANVVVDAGHTIQFDGCTFTALGGAGIDLENGSQSNVVSGCRFYDISGSGIQVGDITQEDHHPSDPRRIVKDNLILNNVVTRVGAEYTDAIGIFYGYTEGTVIAHNEVFGVPYTGVSGGWGWGMPDAGGGHYACPVIFKTPTTCKNNILESNHIYDVMRVRHDGGGIYTLGRQPGTIIRNNHIHDSHAPFGGIYLDEGSSEIEVVSNVVYRAQTPVFYHTCGHDASIKKHDNFTAPPSAASDGIIGHALKGGSTVRVAHDAKLDPAQFTVTAWIRLDKYPEGGDARRWIFCKTANEHANANISLVVDGKNVTGYLNIGGGAANSQAANGTGEPLKLNVWMPVALTYDGDTLRVYCGGHETASKQIGKARTPGDGELTIGERTDRFAPFTCGDIDEVRLYNRPLSLAEIQQDAKTIHDGLVQAWDFEKDSAQDSAVAIVKDAGLETQYRALLEGLLVPVK